MTAISDDLLAKPKRAALESLRRRELQQAVQRAEAWGEELAGILRSIRDGTFETAPSFFECSPAAYVALLNRLAVAEATVAVPPYEHPHVAVRRAWKGVQARWPEASSRFLGAVRQAHIRGHEWLLTPNEYEVLANQPCDNCGGPTGNGIGLDRLDHRHGYEMSNVRPCCGPCNVKRGRKPLAIASNLTISAEMSTDSAQEGV